MKRTVILPIAALLLAACGESPLAPESKAMTLAPEQASLSVAAGATSAAIDFAADLDAITTRVLPSLSDATAAEGLRVQIATLSAALSAGNKAEAASAVAAARALLTPDIGAFGDVGSIDLVLNNVALALQ